LYKIGLVIKAALFSEYFDLLLLSGTSVQVQIVHVGIFPSVINYFYSKPSVMKVLSTKGSFFFGWKLW